MSYAHYYPPSGDIHFSLLAGYIPDITNYVVSLAEWLLDIIESTAALCAPKVGRVGASRRRVGCMQSRVGHSEVAPAAGLQLTQHLVYLITLVIINCGAGRSWGLVMVVARALGAQNLGGAEAVPRGWGNGAQLNRGAGPAADPRPSGRTGLPYPQPCAL